MSTIEPQGDEVAEATTAEVGDASDASTDSDALIMAEVADSALDATLSEQEAATGARKAMGPPIDWDIENAAMASTETGIDEGQELTPPPLAAD